MRLRARHDLRTSATTAIPTRGAGKREALSKGVPIAFDRLVLSLSEVGTHRDRRAGLAEVFGFKTLRDVPFVKLAGKVKAAYEGSRVPSHQGWPAQRDSLRWLVDKGSDAIYTLNTEPISVRHGLYQRYYVVDGHHRALALYILGEAAIRAKVVR
jgi:hypothetical protein